MSLFPTPLNDLTEKEFAGQVIDTAKNTGWLRYHTYRSERSESGWPDEALLRERLILAELKTEKNKPTDAQIKWLTRLAQAGVETYLWRPSDLDDIALILSKRWDFTPFGLVGVKGTVQHWTPNSLWTPAGCRHDQRQAAA